jgi:hypothetical protein
VWGLSNLNCVMNSLWKSTDEFLMACIHGDHFPSIGKDLPYFWPSRLHFSSFLTFASFLWFWVISLVLPYFLSKKLNFRIPFIYFYWILIFCLKTRKIQIVKKYILWKTKMRITGWASPRLRTTFGSNVDCPGSHIASLSECLILNFYIWILKNYGL